MYVRDTIAAIATAPGNAGVGIIRISGKDALSVSQRVFVPRSAQKMQPRVLRFGDFCVPNGAGIDSGFAVWFKEPSSYTGEDVVEFHCHGGMVILRSVLDALLTAGVRMAQPGEFTKRAFLNGKMDLTQAEAVADLIGAGSDTAAQIARSQYGGKLSQAVNSLSSWLLTLLAQMEAEIDYPEEDIEVKRWQELGQQGEDVIKEMEKLLASYHNARVYREGISLAILGRPNVGKSSLLNRFAGEERAIVTDVPGTTRDLLEVPVNIRGIPLRFIDTAGIRETGDVVEKIGVTKAKQAAEQADLILLLFDASRPLGQEDWTLLEMVPQCKTIPLFNKVDLPIRADESFIKGKGWKKVYKISAVTGEGVEELKGAIEGQFISGKLDASAAMITNQRHFTALKRAKEALQAALAGWHAKPADILAHEVREAWQVLGEITGGTWTEDLLNCIFERFCLGK